MNRVNGAGFHAAIREGTMSSRRADRVASVIHAEIARLVREEVKDPRVGTISITEVMVKPDLSAARVRYLPLGGAGDRGGGGRAAGGGA